jgi:hypothetical protein
MLVCYAPKYPTRLKCNINYMYINFWALSSYKLVFKGRFYLTFVSAYKPQDKLLR